MYSIKKFRQNLSRREFLKLSAVGMGAFVLAPIPGFPQEIFPSSERLGRIVGGRVEVKLKPDNNSQTVGILYDDAVIPWYREVIGNHSGRLNQRWVETSEGYVWGGIVQPVQNKPNVPVPSIEESVTSTGMWVEVTIPYVDLLLENPPARAPWLQYQLSNNLPPRFYYNQIVWVDQIRKDDNGQVWYRLNQKYGSGDIFWAKAEGLRPLIPEEISVIHPDVENKKIVVDINHQTLSCFEGTREVFFTRISSGALFDAWGNKVDNWATPLGENPVWRKAISLPLSGGTASSGWSLPAVGWISLFVGSGVAIHSTFWHNNYGEPSSRGCVNAKPEDAKWIFRWAQPYVQYDPGDSTVGWPGGTIVQVIEG